MSNILTLDPLDRRILGELQRDATLSKSSIDSGEFDTVFAGAADFNTVGYDFNTAGFNIDGIDKLKR